MKTKTEHAGFTLIELLVVMAILMFLFGLGIAILPAVYQKWTTTKGAEMVQGALARARQEARRSGHATGIRLSGATVTDLSFIQQPIDLTGGTLTAQGGAAAATIQGADLSSVQNGDYLEICGSGLPHQIQNAGLAGGLNLASPIPFTIPAPGTSQYRIMRQPQPMKGERPIKLPDKVAVDMGQCSTDGKTAGGIQPSGNDANGAYYDVLFSPGGGLTGRWLGTDKVILYVRDTSFSDVTQGKPTLIVIYVRTGLIAAHPVDTSNAPDPNNGGQPNRYSFCNNGQSSGL
jgi:prepilin-type N-terminal cleavage/methylation domain-containing protein